MHIRTNVFSGDVLVLQVSSDDHRLFRVADWFPDSATIHKYKTPVRAVSKKNQKVSVNDALWDGSRTKAVSDHYTEKVYGRSHKQTGYVWDASLNHYDVGVSKDACSRVALTSGELESFQRAGISVGSPILLQVSDSLPCCNRVLKWNPDKEEVEKYKIPVRIVNRR